MGRWTGIIRIRFVGILRWSVPFGMMQIRLDEAGTVYADTSIDVEKASKSKIGKLPYLDTRKVAVETLKRAEKGKACYTPGRFYLAYQAAGKILPHSLMMKLNRL